MYQVSISSIKTLFPHAIGEYVAAFTDATNVLSVYQINSRLRVCHLLAQVGAETGGLRILIESLNYSAERLMAVWPRHFTTLDQANAYAHNEQKLGNFIYGPTIHPDLGNTQSGDGYRFRGRGLLQITGRAAYQKFGTQLNLDLLGNPDLAFDHNHSLAIAAAEFSSSKYNGINTLINCDNDRLEDVTKAVNGGLIGLDQRRDWLQRAKNVFGAASSTPAGRAGDAPDASLEGATSRAIASGGRQASF